MSNPRLRPFLAVIAAATVLGLTAFGTASASVPPTEPPVTDQPATDQPATEGAATGPEFTQSWALTTGAGPNGSDPGTRPTFEYEQAAGTSLSDTVVLFNLGDLPQEFRVYATDGFNNDAGALDFLDGTQTPTDVGSWITLPASAASIVLPPGQSATIPFTLAVPIDATPGDHVGGIVASSIASGQTGNAVVNVDRRTGPSLRVRVTGELTPRLSVIGLTSDYSQSANPFGGSARISFTVENQGNVQLGGPMDVSVSGPLGLGRASVPSCTGDEETPEAGVPLRCVSPLAPLLPGQRVELSYELDGVPALVIDTTSVTIDSIGPDGDIIVTTGTARSFVPPITVLLIGLVALLAWRAVVGYRRHRSDSGLGDEGAPGNEPAREPQFQ